MTAVSEIDPFKEYKESSIERLEYVLALAREGKVRTVLICYEMESQWGTLASKSINARLDAAMLMELAMKRLGFVPEP